MPQGEAKDTKNDAQGSTEEHGVTPFLNRIGSALKETLMGLSKKAEAVVGDKDEDKEAPKKAIALLKEDHRTVEDLFKQFEEARKGESGGAKKKVELAQKICTELTIHALVEEKLFYPAAREALGKDGADMLDEATVEHSSLKMLMAEIDGAAAGAPLFDAHVKVLQEYVSHHVKEEEHEMFPKLEGKLDQEALGAQMNELKAYLKAQSEEAKAPRAGAKATVQVPLTAITEEASATEGESEKSTPAAEKAEASEKTAAAEKPDASEKKVGEKTAPAKAQPEKATATKAATTKSEAKSPAGKGSTAKSAAKGGAKGETKSGNPSAQR